MNALQRLKKRLGYYEARRKLLRRPFEEELRPTDAFIVGHPKSGNTWLAYMLAVLLVGDREDEVTLRNVGRFVPFVHGRDDRIRRYRHLPNPRLFRNENPQYPDLYPRTIYLIRDPRAVLVSFWHMYQVIFGLPEFPFGQFLDHYMSMEGIFDTWNSKLVRWDEQVADHVHRSKTDDRVLLVRYEDMVADRSAALAGVSRFLELPLSPRALDRAVERGSFESMRDDEDTHGAEAYEGKALGTGKFVRAGRTDGWLSEIEPAHAARIEAEFRDAMKLTGYL